MNKKIIEQLQSALDALAHRARYADQKDPVLLEYGSTGEWAIERIQEHIEQLKSESPTVKEVFELAGYPVPNGSEIYANKLVCDSWDWSCWDGHGDRMDRTFKEWEHQDFEWFQEDNDPSAGSFCQPNIANLPAADCLSALPAVAREAFDRHVGGLR